MASDVIAILKQERVDILSDVARIDKAIAILGGTVAAPIQRKQRRPLSDSQKAAARERMRKYWEGKRAEKAAAEAEAAKAAEPKPRLVRDTKPKATDKPKADAQPTPEAAT